MGLMSTQRALHSPKDSKGRNINTCCLSLSHTSRLDFLCNVCGYLLTLTNGSFWTVMSHSHSVVSTNSVKLPSAQVESVTLIIKKESTFFSYKAHRY